MSKTFQSELEKGDSKEYEFETIWDSKVYTRKFEGYLPGLNYFISWMSYLEEENN